MHSTTITNRCACGKRINRYAHECSRCHRARMNLLHAQAQAHVDRGTCPHCGTSLKRNLALTGWWQCGAYGEPSRRKPELRNAPSCSFQCFTE